MTASENLSLIKKNAFSEVRLLWFFLFAVSTGYIRVIILSAIRALRKKKEAKPVGVFFQSNTVYRDFERNLLPVYFQLTPH